MKFALKKPVETREPTVVVDPTLALGKHVFQLVVVNANGRQSEPALATVVVSRGETIPVRRPGNTDPPPIIQ